MFSNFHSFTYLAIMKENLNDSIRYYDIFFCRVNIPENTSNMKRNLDDILVYPRFHNPCSYSAVVLKGDIK